MTAQHEDVATSQGIDQFRNRRKMAWASFVLMSAVGVAVLAFGLSDDLRAKRVDSMSFLLGTVFGVWTSIVLTYYGISTLDDQAKRNKAKMDATQSANPAPASQPAP